MTASAISVREWTVMGMDKERNWQVYAERKVLHCGMYLNASYETTVTAEDAGMAWLRFQKAYEGYKWHEISVTEVKVNE